MAKPLLCIPIIRDAYSDQQVTPNFVSVCPYHEKRTHPSFVNISPTLVIDTSMERSSRVLRHGNPKIWFFQKRSKCNFDLYFDLSWSAYCFFNKVPTGINSASIVSIYNVGDTSSSLRGSTSSFVFIYFPFHWIIIWIRGFEMNLLN